MCFIWQKDIGGCESWEVYIDKLKRGFSDYRSVWDNIRDVGTDGYLAKRSTSWFAGITANGDIGKSFITQKLWS